MRSISSQPDPISTPLLTAHNLSFAYVASRPVVRNISFTVARGAMVGILGPNGSGKTTLLRLLAGIVRPSAGQIALEGTNLSTIRRMALARRMAMVPQETHPVFDYTVVEVAVMGRHPHLGPFEVEGPEDLAIVREALAATGTLNLEDRLFNRLSGGEKQRVVIAAALAQLGSRGRSSIPTNTRADILLLDEPTASLDLAYQLEIASILIKLNQERGLTVIVSTHDLNLAARLCDDLVLVKEGRVLASGSVADVLTNRLVRDLYGVDVEISRHPRTGQLTVTPLGGQPPTVAP